MLQELYNKKVVAFFLILVFASVSFATFGLTHWQDGSDPTSKFQPLNGDATQYNAYAKNLFLKGVYSDGPKLEIFREPGYPFYLFIIYELFGLNNYRAVILSQLLLLVFTGYFIYLTLSVYGEKSLGLLAGILTVLIPYYGYYSVELVTELIFTFLLVFSFWLLVRIIKIDKTNVFYYISLGIILGCATLIKAQILFFPIFLFALLLFIAGVYKRPINIDVKKGIVGFLFFTLVVGGWMTYVYSRNGYFAITEGRQDNLIYYRAVRAELSYKDQFRYLSLWLKRSAMGGESEEFLDKYEFKQLYEDYYAKVTNPQQAVNMRNENIRTIIRNLDKYLIGNGIEFVKLIFVEHTYAGVYNKYLRAGFYLGLYSLFLSGMHRFIFIKQKEFKLIFGLAMLFLCYNWLFITAFDVIPRYNTPYLVFYLLIGLTGVYPFLKRQPVLKKYFTNVQ